MSVSFDKDRNKYMVRVYDNGVPRYLGRFKTKSQARLVERGAKMAMEHQVMTLEDYPLEFENIKRHNPLSAIKRLFRGK